MDTTRILADLRADRDRIERAIAAIEALDKEGSSTTRAARPSGASSPARGRRRMSPAARKRIAAAMKARWAERKRAGKVKAG